MLVRSLFFAFSLLTPVAFATDTLSHNIEYYSNVTLTDFNSGKIEDGRYFCVKAMNHGGEVIACAVSNKSDWASSYEHFFQQAHYYYTTGKSFRLYVQPNVWTHPKFTRVYSNKAIAGFASCHNSRCMGPTKDN
ncbi:subtilase family AB5 toxin binding subunit [Proteus faecis]|uniref:Subtilase family AB5 toxin binding subunit n=1 Tax=Proteus faecis TaxID=2050967 RepID=A0AAW7CLL3_9GAMM|nr:subtilase family AB5 toxin binding subunit [Proteus faecis]MBG3014610.1 subtilase cytotoxin subunit B [Proteus mirabilis]MDL5166000.1 subtilase family AB5 toxin binding subunit [Proteus faecis]MDL5273736.1 subtilase family AB5 toxin binding subunit [Proteus faecis]MDL5277306.1 subtilase family AB5 toxin binding subunit [Proteus faecis]MDL5306296.1 subtilase family AB5 toxin binding subunit [Proteus faecis]